MSIICRFSANTYLDRIFIKYCLLNGKYAFYSRRSNSKNSDSQYKVVKSKVRLDDNSDLSIREGGPNWELFSPRGNRFYLPGSLGPAWQSSATTVKPELALHSLIDFESKELKKLHVSTKTCPVLLRNNLHELFPAPEVFSKGLITLITLSCQDDTEVEQGAKNFVLAASELCSTLRLNGYWADFMNPFSGKPFYSYASGKNLYRIDQRFRGLDMKFENFNECTIISSDENANFSGNVFTNAPNDLLIIKSIIE